MDKEKLAGEPTSTEIKALWKQHGGRQHGPMVEHYSIEEQAFYRFARALLALRSSPDAVAPPPAATVEAVAKAICRDELKRTNSRRDFATVWGEESEVWIMNATAALAAMQPLLADREGWQPIETAPAGQRGFLWCADENPMTHQPRGTMPGIINLYRDHSRHPKADGMVGDWIFTHWRPLPEPPEASE